MAATGSGWSITGNSQNTEYTHKWMIENFDFAMEVGKGKIESHSFSIPGVPGEFHMVVERKTDPASTAILRGALAKIGDQEVQVKFFFSVSLMSTAEDTNAAGKLEIIKEGAETLYGHFGDSAEHKFVALSIRPDFVPDSALKYQDNGGNRYQVRNHRFHTTGSTCLLNLVARVTIPGKLRSLGGAEEEEEENRLLDFQPLLSDPKHSDIVLKCGDTRFLCHKAILALR